MDVFIFQILCQFTCNLAGRAFAFGIYRYKWIIVSKLNNNEHVRSTTMSMCEAQEKQLKPKTQDIILQQLKRSSTRQHIKQSIHSKLSNDNVFVFMLICCCVHNRCNVRIQMMNSVLVYTYGINLRLSIHTCQRLINNLIPNIETFHDEINMTSKR
jgi:hypothetical protein